MTMLAPESGVLDLFLQAADDATLLSPLEQTLHEIGTAATEALEKLSALQSQVTSEIGGMIPGYRDYKMTNAFEDAETLLVIDLMSKAVKALREGHEVTLASDFVHEVLGATSHKEAFENWDPAALVKAREAKFGNLANAAWQQALHTVKRMVDCRRSNTIDREKKTVSLFEYLFEKVDYGRDIGMLKLSYRITDNLARLKVFLRVVMSIHTGQPFDTCQTDLPHTINLGSDGRMSPRDLYRWQASDTPGIARIRPKKGGELVFEFTNEETFRRFMTEMDALPSYDY